jgi:hypothetical protein
MPSGFLEPQAKQGGLSGGSGIGTRMARSSSFAPVSVAGRRAPGKGRGDARAPHAGEGYTLRVDDVVVAYDAE